MSAQTELHLTPNAAGKYPLVEIVPRLRLTPAEHGQAGASDAAKHLKDHAPGWVLERLGDALLSLRGREFTTDDVRRIAGPTVDAWLGAEKVRINCFSGWWQRRVKRFHLQRVGSTPSTRDDRRGAWIGVWRFPTTGEAT